MKRDWNKIQETDFNERETREIVSRLRALGSDRRKPKDVGKDDHGTFRV